MNNQLGAAVVLAIAAAASAQSGTLDQVSPVPVGAGSAGFNLSASVLTWQQQIRAGLSGTLEGISVSVTGSVGASAQVRIRLGNTWSTGPTVFTGSVVKTTAATEVIFVNMAGSNIALTAGQTFVMEMQGDNNGMGLQGSYKAPPTPPLYPEPLFINQGQQGDGGWRFGFSSYMLTGTACYPDCNGDHALNLSDFGCFQTKFALGCP